MPYKYTVPASNGVPKYKIHIGKKDKITDWTVRANTISFISNVRQKELDKKEGVIVEEIKG